MYKLIMILLIFVLLSIITLGIMSLTPNPEDDMLAQTVLGYILLGLCVVIAIAAFIIKEDNPARKLFDE